MIPTTTLGLFVGTANEIGRQTGSVLIFAIGIIVGLFCVVLVDVFARQRILSDYDAWVASGRPERRKVDRRADDLSRR